VAALLLVADAADEAAVMVVVRIELTVTVAVAIGAVCVEKPAIQRLRTARVSFQ
jgi:hypothetical protein